MSAMAERDLFNGMASREASSGGPLTVVTVCLDDDTRDLLKLFIEKGPLVRLRRHLERYGANGEDTTGNWGDELSADIYLIDFDKDRQKAMHVAEEIHNTDGEAAIFAVSAQSEPDSIIQAMRCGCREYLVKELDREKLLNAIARVAGRKREPRETERAQVIAFLGAKGGVGVTTLATQMAALLASSHSCRALLVDLHPHAGDAALYLRHTNFRYHAFDLVDNQYRLDADLLQSFVLRHSSGLDVIPGPEGSEPTRRAEPGAITRTLEFLRSRYDVVVLDLATGLSPENLEIVRVCDRLYLVTVAEISAVRNLVRYFDYFASQQLPHDHVQVVLNRNHKRGLITEEQIEKAIRRKIEWKVPNQYAQVMNTITSGNPVGQLSGSEVTRSLNEWAGTISGKTESTDRKKDNSRILGLWSR